ncbi:hypothetical protein EDD17DRAFT_1009564 [Pisolithus thermaeus]|nr:hypothetical protein EV401DRAFT_729513 [Pisolithus croceorrhizus]KAI6158449.1 hypothetical protein EDD17DRAFT_1009564 [Pisolithus thermaeus]
MLRERDDERYVIVVVGRTGVGVSSLVNLLAGCPVSQNSPDARPRTRRVREHLISIRQRYISVYEIPGFGGDIREETIIGHVRSLHSRRRVDLVLYCMRQLRETLMPRTFERLQHILHGVPFVAAVTELEQLEMMEKWWSTPSEEGRPTNERMLADLGMTFQHHVCITTLPEAMIATNETLMKLRGKSERDVSELVCRCFQENPGAQGTGGERENPGTGGLFRRIMARLGVRAAIRAL